MEFVHLHLHSQYSFLDGASTIDTLLNKAGMLGMSALALTDHNRLTGAIRFYQKARACGIKPIIGVELDMAGGYHLTLLCKDSTGYSNLCRLLTAAHLSSATGSPAACVDMLREHRSGLIALSGCSKGEIPSLLQCGKVEEARRASCFYRDVYGEDYFIELICHPSRYGMAAAHRLAAFARDMHIPAVATNNVHYADREDYRIKELLNAISRNVPVASLKGCRTVEQYLKTAQEMRELFRDFPGAIEMTAEIADRCNLNLDLGRPRFPGFNLPEGVTSYEYLRSLAYTGAYRKYTGLSVEVKHRLERELETIAALGFCSYFLVVWDIVRWAKGRGIRCQARGSAVDSLVVYALDISAVDPVYYNLLFERFMHPLRREPPDIDLDIDRRRRDEVRDYIYATYGEGNVACVGTISTYMARGAIRDVGKALQLPQEIIEEACKGIHFLSASGLMSKMDMLPELKESTVYRRPELAHFFKLCAAIDGFPRHLSVHLGGLLIGEGNLSDLVPLERSSGGDIISQYDKDDIERLGIIKMDVLALPTMTVIEDTVAAVKEGRGIEIDIDAIPRYDARSFALLRSGRTIGLFQLESPAQREMAGRLLPDSFDDIIVSISLVRPGPLKSDMDKTYLTRRYGREPVSYLHPLLEDALSETMGVILYQEQVLKCAHDLAGMSYAEADGFRRAMTHDRTGEEMEKMRGTFIDCSSRKGVSRTIAEEVFSQLAAFAAYGFCKAHAVAYALLSYQTLWLKCHYPAEFFAALLSNQPMGYYPPRVLVADARRFGIQVLPPDVNNSFERYTVEDGAIRVGLKQVKGLSCETIESIVMGRVQSKYTSLRGLVLRSGIGRTALEKLVHVGACDCLGRRQDMVEQLADFKEIKCIPQSRNLPLFHQIDIITETGLKSETSVLKEQLLVERELLSLELSAHPLDFCNLQGLCTKIKDLPALASGEIVRIAGSVIRYQTPPTRNGNRVVYIIMEDGTGVADITVFGDVQQKCGKVLFRSGWLVVEGMIQRRGPKALSIIAREVAPLHFPVEGKLHFAHMH